MADKVINIGNSDNKVTVNVTDKIVCPTFDGTATKVGHKLSFGNKTFDGSSTVVLSGADLGSVDLTSELTITGLKTFSGETYLDSLNANTGLISGNLRVVNEIIGNLTGNALTASIATKLGTSTVGSSSKPIYLNNGVPTEISITSGSANVNRPIVVYTPTGEFYTVSGITANYATSTLTATTFSGNLSGNASTATKLQTARTLTIGNTGKSFDGSSNISWTLSEIGAASSNHTHNYASSDSAGGAANWLKGSYTWNGGQQMPNYFGKNKIGALMMNTKINGNSQYKDFFIIDCYNEDDAGGAVAFGVNRQSLGAYIMRSTYERTSWKESAELLGTHNYASYTVKKDGTGASGTWNINISGNASTVTKLLTARNITLTGSITGSVLFDGTKDISIDTITNHTHNFESLISKPTTIEGYGITDALVKKSIITKNDYEWYVILLCKIGNSTSLMQHTINGTLWSTSTGVNRYQAAYINIWYSSWSEGHHLYYGFTPFGVDTKCRLVTCTYQSDQYLAIAHESIQSCKILFNGSYSNILFTPILYYTSKTGTINNLEIYDSISEVTSYNKLAFTTDNVASATKLTSSAGSEILPIYFSDGVPVACTASSVFSNLSNSGNDLSLTIAGQNRTLTVAYATSAGYTKEIANSGILDSQEKIDNFITANKFLYAIFKTTDSNNVNFYNNDGILLSIPWRSVDYGVQMAFDDYTTATVKVRSKSKHWGNWYTLFHSGNYNNYVPKLDGTGASGTWNISITGTAATATNVAWSGITNKPNFVNSFGTETGDITIRGGQTENGSVNLVMSNNELLASIVGLGSNAYTSTAYLPLAGGDITGPTIYNYNMYNNARYTWRNSRQSENNGGRADDFIRLEKADGSFNAGFGIKGTNEIDEYMFIGYDSSFKGLNLRIGPSSLTWGDNTIYHTGNLSPMTTSHPANNITKTNIDNWNSVHTWYTTATASDTTNTIDTWKEIEAFVSSFKKGDNLATYLANNYLAKSGGTISSTSFAPLIIERSGSTNAAAILFKNSNGTLGYIGMDSLADRGLERWRSDGMEKYTILDSSNSSVSLSGSTLSVKINGTTKSLTNTDSKVTQTVTTSNNTDYRPVILGESSNDLTNSFSNTTSSVYAAANVYIKPDNGNLYTKGSLNASTTVTAGTTVTAATSVTSTAGDFYVGGTSGSRCHIKMDTNNKCIKFIFD